MKKKEKVDYFSFKEISQNYFPYKNNSSFRYVTQAGDLIKDLINNPSEFNISKNAEDISHRLYNKAANFFLSATEEIIGQSLYINRDHKDFNNQVVVDDKLKVLAKKLIDGGILKYLNYGTAFNDEPKIFKFSGSYGDFLKKSDCGRLFNEDGASGSSLTDVNKALMRCLGEVMERTCGGFYKKENFLLSSFRELKNRGLNAINPKTIVGLSDKQITGNSNLKRVQINENSIFKWAWANSLTTNKKVLIPAQLVYVPYQYENEEAIIRLPITTGAALHSDSSEAIYRGICEVVERDAFMIFWLNKLSPPIVDLEKSFNGKLKWLLKLFKRYNLELYILDITTDISIPTLLTLIIDRTGLGPAVIVSNKSDLDPEKAILGSIEETLKVRPWLRRQIIEEPDFVKEINNKKLKEIRTLKERCFFWSPTEMIKQIEFLLKGSRKTLKTEEITLSAKEKLDKVLGYLGDNDYDAIAVETTIPPVKKLGFSSFVVIIPQAQSLHLTEKYKCLGGRRLYEVPVKLGYLKKIKKEEELNPIPHPFP